MDKDEMSNLYREPSIDASYQVSVHFAKRIIPGQAFALWVLFLWHGIQIQKACPDSFTNMPFEAILVSDCRFLKIFSSETAWQNELKLGKFQFIWLLGFRGEDVLEIDQSETRIACGGHVC
jgi:hypothetical protein